MKILYVTTIGSTMGFFPTLIKSLINAGHTVDIATNEDGTPVPACYAEWGCRIHHISTSRSPFSSGNIKAIKQIKAIAKDYDIVHCHTPLAAAATRLACRSLRKKQGLRVIYTAHGFHFFKGAPLKNKLIYYPVEWFCSFFTDVLITINKEDYERAKKHFHAARTEYVPGVGVDTARFRDTVTDIAAKRQELDIPDGNFVILSVGELNQNKNHESVIMAIAGLPEGVRPFITYVIAGTGPNRDILAGGAELYGVSLKLAGFRRDVNELYKLADLYVHPSYREGLPVALMEAMSAGTPCIASKIRGCRDLLPEESLFAPGNITRISELIEAEYQNPGRKEYDMSGYDIDVINERMTGIYESVYAQS